MEVVLFLLGYPLAIFANISTDFLKSCFSRLHNQSLKKLFIESFIKSLDENIKHANRINVEYIKGIKKLLKENGEKLFDIICEAIGSNHISIIEFRESAFIKILAKKIAEEYELSETRLAETILIDCMRFYEVAFFSKMTEKDGIQIIINMIERLHSEVAKKSDIEKLRIFIKKELNNKKDKTLDGLFSEEIFDLITDEIGHPESELFSSSITHYMTRLKKKVEILTKEQFQIIQYLRYHKRVVISGCAGSGKTLLVAEKALRLDSAGIKTLILCHNPYLANHIRNLTIGSPIDVYDFTSWIYLIINKESSPLIDWNEYIEPLNSEISMAFDVIMKSTHYYDSVIVDEAQDFRELWWLIVEAIIEKSSHKILYIFHDDNQALLPYRSKYPISLSPFSMSRNCRNGGEIFEIVKRFHPNAPITSYFLKGIGFVKISSFIENNFASKIETAIRDASNYANHNQIVIITNELSASKSIINGFRFYKSEKWNWRVIVINDLNRFKNTMIERIKYLRQSKNDTEIADILGLSSNNKLESYFDIPYLSNEEFPTKNDIKEVIEYAKLFHPAFGINAETYHRQDDIFWSTDKDETSLKIESPSGELQYEKFLDQISFYSSKHWADGIPIIQPLEITANNLEARLNEYQFPLFSINSYKGLESDAVILFFNSLNERLVSELYIGTSRAIGYLHIVISSKVLSNVAQFNDNNFIDRIYKSN